MKNLKKKSLRGNNNTNLNIKRPVGRPPKNKNKDKSLVLTKNIIIKKNDKSSLKGVIDIKSIKKKNKKEEREIKLKKKEKNKKKSIIIDIKPKIKRKYNKKKPLEVLQYDNTAPIKKRKKKTKRNRKQTKNMYFTVKTEDAIDLFNKTTCLRQRESIFREHIKYPFEKLVENVFNTFKFSYFETGSLDVQKEVLTHLVANINKYEKEKGKAFSYFSIVAKNFLIFLNNTNYARFNRTVEIGEHNEENTIQLQVEDGYHKNTELYEFIQLMIVYWENNVGKIFDRQRDLDIANAVVELFRNSDKIDIYNKKALYLFIREISDCKTSQITKVINKMKTYYYKAAASYEKIGFIEENCNVEV